MADGSTKPIQEVKNGDVVRATDPVSGDTSGKTVVELHKNQDTDLTDLTVTTPGGQVSDLHTTQRHPFWSVSRGDWVDARDLTVDEVLRSDDGSAVVVARVHNFAGDQTMNDLTVDEVHTYYVVADDTPVLVHNCGGARFEVDARGVATDLTASMKRGGMDITRAGKRKVAAKSRANNGGRTVCDDCGVVTVPATQSRSGVTPASNETRVDHMWPKSLGGPGSPWNGRITCFDCNAFWSNRPKGLI
jgi:hypothetical protein